MDDYREVIGTRSWMSAVEPRLEQRPRTTQGDKVEQLSRSARLQEVGGTSSRMNEVESSLERRSGATHDFMDEEGRIASGTAIEDAKAEMPPASKKTIFRGALDLISFLKYYSRLYFI